MTYKKIGVVDAKSNTPNGTDGLNSELEASSAVAKVRKKKNNYKFSKNCCIFALAVCEMHTGVNSNHLLIRLARESRADFF